MNETMKMIESINKHSKELKIENLKRAEQKRKEDKKNKAWEIIGLSIFFGWILYVAYIVLLWLAPMYL